MAYLVILALVVVIVFLLVRVLNLTDSSHPPKIISSDSHFTNTVLESCPIFFERYSPPVIWGKSGHCQTLVGALFGRRACPELKGALHTTKLHDGTVVTYEIYSPDKNSLLSVEQEKPTIITVPGIANCSETKYVRTFADYAIRHGFKVAVLNHLGAKEEGGLTTPRIFTYGGTEELAAMVSHITSVGNHQRLIGVGFSMGANILMKYLGEEPSRQELFECAVSVCQGYDILRAKTLLHEWDGLRRFYNWGITQSVKKVLDRNMKVLFQCPKFTSSVHHVRSSSSLVELDDAYVKKMAGFHNLDEFYAVNSSCNYINQIKIPVFLLNASDDPLIPEELFDTPYNHVKCNESAVFVVTHHGGHLGFYEGGFFTVFPLTWLDKAVIQYIKAVLKVKNEGKLSSLSEQDEEYFSAS